MPSINELLRQEWQDMDRLLARYVELETRDGFARILKCPACGYRDVSGHIGAVFCGPHGRHPARRMITVRQTGDEEEMEK